MAKKYGVASDYIKYTSRIKSDTSDGVAVEASQVVDLEEDKLQSDINKELKASIASASGKTYSKSEIDSKDTATLTSAKSYADTKKTEAVSAAATDATTKANSALASAKSYADQKVSALGSVYTTKGSCTAAQLKALTSAKAGDVWNITDAITIDGKAYPAGVNVVCVTAFSAAIDPAVTKNWDALQGLQDLTSYAKKSEIEEVAVANVKFAQEEDVPQGNGVSFKKTITYVNGREATTESDFNLLPATSTKAGVMSAADKVKLDAVDGKVGDVLIKIEQDLGYAITKNSETSFGTSVIGKNANIGMSALIGSNAMLGDNAAIQDGISIGTDSENDNFYISKGDTLASIGYNVSINKGVIIGTDVSIGSDIELGQEGSQQNIFGVTMGTVRGLGLDASGNFIWEISGSKKTAATTDDLSALATRVSALEDLLKLA
jgi:acetyltransferase-like isoleucine patch superfamily enzyme